ncbi:hypothetical protein [Paenibacillus sp. S150]|uniref:hypothetical protein n=1 Tax=Paenibacillus sp. S150 TaxID=2749826 RepID=UPI001C5646CF|nr:hypothetical protein [Paenibacillus sp. S150]MBW4082792.1 hypothetical protein [Paenibacillus sp. S150]
MSDFMKNIVSEVLQRNRQPSSAGAVRVPGAPNAYGADSSPLPPGVPSPAAAASSPSPHTCSADSRADCPHTCTQPGNCRKPPPEIRRTNYQKALAARRIALIGAAAAAVPGGAAAAINYEPASPPYERDANSLLAGMQADTAVKKAGSLQPGRLPQDIATAEPGSRPSPAATLELHNRQFVEQCLSPLLLRTLPVKTSPPRLTGDHAPEQPAAPAPVSTRGMDSPGSPALSVPFRTPGSPEPFRLPLQGSLEGWLFPEISSRLRPLLGISGRNYSSAGVLSSPVCHPGQLFAAEELLPQDPGLEADMGWSPAGNGFELKLFSHDPDRIASLLAELAACIQGQAARSVQIYTSLTPGPLLRRYLGAGQLEALAVIDAGSRWSGIGTAEQLLFNHPDTGLSIRTEHNCCIVSGASARIQALESELKRLAD